MAAFSVDAGMVELFNPSCDIEFSGIIASCSFAGVSLHRSADIQCDYL
jgi:hypothetical protein